MWVLPLPASAQIQTTLGGRRALVDEEPEVAPRSPPPNEEAPSGGDRDDSDVELLPPLTLARVAGWSLAPEPAPSNDAGRIADELDRYFDDHVREDQVAAGDVDGWYYDMQRRMRREFDPDLEEATGERREGMTFVQKLVDELSRYASGPERPIDPPNAMPPELANQHHDDGAQAIFEWMDQTNLVNAPANWYRVDLRVIQNPEGVVSGAWVLETSGSETVDRAALDAVGSGTIMLPPPPEHIVRERFAITSDWAFEAADVATYLNQAGCVDDPVRGGVQCAVLGRGIVRTRIRLLRVYDADHPTIDLSR